jgi:RNA polymerase sigma-70 factor (ECF subfamily)
MTLEDLPSLDPDRLLAQTEFVRRLAYRLVQDPSAADDLAQQTWLARLLRAPRRLREPRAWFTTVARNLARSTRRRELRRLEREQAAAPREALPPADRLVEEMETHARVVQAVIALREPYRRTIILYFFHDLSAADIATREQAPVETVRTRLRRALVMLRERLEHELGGGERCTLLLLACAHLPAAGPTTLTTLSGVIGMTTTTKILVAGAIAVAASLATWQVVRSDAAETAPRDVASAPVAQSTPAPPPVAAARDEAAALDATRRPIESAPRAAAPTPGAEPSGDPVSQTRASGKALGDADLRSRFAAAAPGSTERASLFALLREQLRSPDPEVAKAAADQLEGLARSEALTADEAQALREDFRALPEDAPHRPTLAAAIAGGLAQDPRLAGFLESLNQEASSNRERVLRVLDHWPSTVLSEYAIGLIENEEDGNVLKVVWDGDRVGAVCTRAMAPRFVTSVETRLLAGGLDRDTRQAGLAALALASLHAPAEAAAAIARVRAAESDPAVVAFAAKLEDMIARGTVSASAIESARKRARR